MIQYISERHLRAELPLGFSNYIAFVFQHSQSKINFHFIHFSKKYTEDVTQWQEDMNFMFELQ